MTSPKTKYHFGGPIGTIGVVLLEVFGPLAAAYICDSRFGTYQVSTGKWIKPEYTVNSTAQGSWLYDEDREPLWNPIDFIWLSAYVAFMAVLYEVLPGKKAKGRPLVNGEVLEYPLNGFASYMCLAAVLGLWTWIDGPRGWIYLANNTLSYTISAIILGFIISIAAYARSFQENVILANNTNSTIHDFVMGRELNPRTRWFLFGNGNFDLKYFLELRIFALWGILDIAYLVRGYYYTNILSIPGLVCTLVHIWYLIDSVWFEDAVLTTMDITEEGCSCQLTLGLIVWLPTVYSMPVKVVTLYPSTAGYPMMGLVVAAMGYAIFRMSNWQKNQFRKDPQDRSVEHLKTMDTKRGTKLLISGWWGAARHVNYTGDWLISLGCCLPVGFDFFPVTFLYPLYFVGLLAHRFYRDEELCREKYGSDWERYKKLVPYRVIPGIL